MRHALAVLGVMTLRRDLKNVDLGRTPPWSGFALINSAPTRDPGMPVLIFQNPKDVVVSPAVTLAHAKKLCRAGTRLRYLPVAGKGHETSGADAAGMTLDWLDARFAGAPERGNCGRF